jgi:hypothetical protein
VLSPCLIWLETGRRVVLDGEVNFRLLPAAVAACVLRAGVMEGGEGGVESLQGDDVVLLVPLVGVERPCTDGSTEGRAAAEQELVGVVAQLFQGEKLKLVGSVSFCGSWECCSCFGLGMGSGGGGCRR